MIVRNVLLNWIIILKKEKSYKKIKNLKFELSCPLVWYSYYTVRIRTAFWKHIDLTYKLKWRENFLNENKTEYLF
jgi:hypothetical protein